MRRKSLLECYALLTTAFIDIGGKRISYPIDLHVVMGDISNFKFDTISIFFITISIYIYIGIFRYSNEYH